ncbi:hypothetical protein [Rhodopirellula bahusiensis]|uniref:hypothetical protein n=1 Tax=Rhodopirellula bahusiensis TaxID=2014065 RepID=UPI0032656F04
MDPNSIDLSSLPVVPIAILAAVFCLAVIVVYGFAMKWSLSLAGCGQHGFGWSFCVSIAAGFSSGLASVGCALFADSLSPVLAFILSFGAAVLTVSVMTQSGPISSGVAYLAFMMIGGLGMALTVVVLVASSCVFFDMGELAKMAQSLEPHMNANVESVRDEEDMWAALPKQLDNAFFESEELVTDVSAPNTPNGVIDEVGSQPKLSADQSADSTYEHNSRKANQNSVQVNPFVQ